MKKKVIILFILFNIILSRPSFATFEGYRVAGDMHFPPYEYVDENGAFKGFNVDVIKAISLVSGIEFEFLPMKWEEAYNSIENGQADIIQGMKESLNRKEKFLFSDSILMNSQSIFVLDSNKDIKDKKDLRGKTIALLKEDIIYREIDSIKDTKIIEYDLLGEALDGLLDNKFDALIGNTLTINYLCNEKASIDELRIVGDALNEQKYGIAVDKDDQFLLAKLNAGLLEIQKNGMYDSLYRKWFGTPIKDTKTQNETWWKITIVVFMILISLIIIVQSINNKLKKVVEAKTEEHKVFINELRHYDKLQFMDKIISSIAHEIRNPMTSIKMYTSQIKNKIDNKVFLQAASEDIPEEIDRIDSLIEEFIEYTSPKKPIIENLNLYKELMKSIKIVKLQMEDIELKIDINKDYYIKFDSSQFKQLVLNIFLNSIDALKDIKDPLIEISADKDDEEITLLFKDNGCGMTEDNLQYIFEPFYTTKEFGNGVGMFVIKQIVDENDANILAESLGEEKGMCISLKIKEGELNEK
ncbi:transporter substrate-binding domain-containing protein [Tissierella sp.]|uniref:transporter substrate-binding domain-containing protein n=1 Tax=Tissierella sp. TaxID=41274 RepID=UPI003F988D5D